MNFECNKMKENLVKNKSFEFSLQVIQLYKQLIDEKEFVLSKQLLKAATSIGANIVEAEAAQSKTDFLSKMSIASKEARETEYWLLLLEKGNLTKIDLKNYLEEIESLKKIITSIVKTTVENLKKK